MVQEAPTSADALILAGLDWNVIQKPIQTVEGSPIPVFLANVRDCDHRILGVLTSRYKAVQNLEAFAFTDELLGEWATYETAGSLQEGLPPDLMSAFQMIRIRVRRMQCSRLWA